MLSIPHDELLKSAARRIVDRHVLRLIKLRPKAPIEERDEPEVVGALPKRRF
jgi:RNA-directed DNA polymerase